MGWKIEESSETLTEEAIEISEPLNYKVILFNDDYTTKDFVIDMLMNVFHKNETDAIILMETVHKKGSAIVGVYNFDIASTRAAIVVKHARENGFPLRCELEVA